MDFSSESQVEAGGEADSGSGWAQARRVATAQVLLAGIMLHNRGR